MREPLGILRVGAFCPVGLDAEQTAGSIMAGVPRKLESMFFDRSGEPIVIGHLPSEVLPPLVGPLIGKRPPLTPLQARLLRLAGPALQEVLDVEITESAAPGRAEPRFVSRALPKGAAPPPLFVAGPQPPPERAALVTGSLLGQLILQAGVPLDVTTSRLFPLGHAGLFTAIKEAEAKVIAPGVAEFVVVGGIDSYFDEERLMQLERERRLLTAGLQDAATPGEGAAFMLIASRNTCLRYGLKPLAWISAVGVGMEPGHRYSDEPLHGNGLSGAVTQTFRELRAGAPPIRLVMAGITGETLQAKEWGIAYLRNREMFAETVRLEHSAEYTGDAGASLAAIMLAVTALELGERNLEGPALCWASSDQAERGALVAEAN